MHLSGYISTQERITTSHFLIIVGPSQTSEWYDKHTVKELNGRKEQRKLNIADGQVSNPSEDKAYGVGSCEASRVSLLASRRLKSTSAHRGLGGIRPIIAERILSLPPKQNISEGVLCVGSGKATHQSSFSSSVSA